MIHRALDLDGLLCLVEPVFARREAARPSGRETAQAIPPVRPRQSVRSTVRADHVDADAGHRSSGHRTDLAGNGGTPPEDDVEAPQAARSPEPSLLLRVRREIVREDQDPEDTLHDGLQDKPSLRVRDGRDAAVRLRTGVVEVDDVTG